MCLKKVNQNYCKESKGSIIIKEVYALHKLQNLKIFGIFGFDDQLIRIY